jgi:hypothetical protein
MPKVIEGNHSVAAGGGVYWWVLDGEKRASQGCKSMLVIFPIMLTGRRFSIVKTSFVAGMCLAVR